jgi:hypothetical protein
VPAPHAGKLVVERKSGKHWRKVRTVRTSKAGRYKVKLPRAGVYRVRAGSVAGTATRISS